MIGLHPKCEYVSKVGIIAGLELRVLFPKDGMEFMEGLQYQFRGGYYTATAPYEVPDGEEQTRSNSISFKQRQK